jgi:hypothetical protein
MLEHVTLTVHEAFSGVAGSISLACWIFLLVKKKNPFVAYARSST